jgi:hypothetical protein
LAEKFSTLFPQLNERQRRLLAAAEARSLGYGGISAVARASGLSIPTIRKGIAELDAEPQVEPGWSRRSGGGRKPSEVADPALIPALQSLVVTECRGDPMSPLLWTTKSTRHLAAALNASGHAVSHSVVAHLLAWMGFSLQGTAKTVEGKQHPDRDGQFRYINDLAAARLGDHQPVVSVDTKKKELVGETPGYANKGREWRPAGDPVTVGVHDFPDPRVGKAIPYGVFDVGANAGWVLVGSDHDTASFAVQSLRRWWQTMGQPMYPNADRLLVCADAGGSNAYRNRLWKVELARFAEEAGLRVTCCHFPPGTSKWNKIEHRLFSAITMNWRGRPLVSHEAVVELIAATTNRSGLTVKAELDRGVYPLGTKITEEQLTAAGVAGHAYHGEWNYDVGPMPTPKPPRTKRATRTTSL